MAGTRSFGSTRAFVTAVFDRRADPSAPELVGTLRKGLPYEALVILLEKLGVPPRQLYDVIGISDRTLARRKSGRLTPAESDRLYRVFRMVAQAKEVLGDLNKARHWLTHPNRALGGESPLALLDTDVGARQVEEVLLRIEHGMYS
jgi:putative toxin-antitoxin system antitoxin component (TIGR02293 family)